MKRRYFLKSFIFFITYFLIPRVSFAGLGNIPEIGTKSPEFSLNGFINGTKKTKSFSLNDYKGSWLVIYFYPEDFTSGCTLEAKGFSSRISQFDDLNTKIIGISSDNLEKHQSFCDEESLEIPLLSDPDGSVSQLYGSWSGSYANRNTFLISPEGIIKAKWIGVKPLRHAEEILIKINQLQKQ